MVSIYAIAGIALVLFYIGYSTGFTLGKGEEPNLRGVVAMLIGGVFTAITWGAAVEGIRAPGAGATVLLFMAAFGALFLFGLGRFVGSLVLIFYDEGPRRRLALICTMGLPVVLVGWILYGLSNAEAALKAEQAAARAVLQVGTYQARFGDHEVNFPGAPVFTVIHPCGTLDRNCTTRFWASAGWNNRKEGPLEIVSIEVNTNPTALQELGAWCPERSAFAQMLWCQITPEDEVRLKRLRDLRGVENERTTSCMQLYNGEFSCRATHDLADGIVGVLNTLTDAEADGRALIEAKRQRAEAVWAGLTEVPHR